MKKQLEQRSADLALYIDTKERGAAWRVAQKAEAVAQAAERISFAQRTGKAPAPADLAFIEQARAEAERDRLAIEKAQAERAELLEAIAELAEAHPVGDDEEEDAPEDDPETVEADDEDADLEIGIEDDD